MVPQIIQEHEQDLYGACTVFAPEQGSLEAQAWSLLPDSQPTHCDQLAGIRRRYQPLQEWIDGFATELASLEERSCALLPVSRSNCREQLTELRLRYHLLRELVARLGVQLDDSRQALARSQSSR